jgi:hypothetical protein
VDIADTMAIGSPIKYPRLSLVVVSIIPLLSSYITAVLVQWMAERRELSIDLSKYISAVIILSIYVIMAFLGGVLLEVSGGIPPGIGFGWTVIFLIGIYGSPTILGSILFDSFLLSNLDTDNGGANSGFALMKDSQSRVLDFLAKADLLFVALNIVSLPSFFISSIIVHSRVDVI